MENWVGNKLFNRLYFLVNPTFLVLRRWRYFLCLLIVYLTCIKEDIAMPATPATTTPSDRIAPKSLLRHRPIAPERTTQEPPAVPRASRTIHRKPAQPAPKPHPAASSTDVPTWKVASTTGHASAAWQVRLVPGIAVGVALAVVLVLLAQLLMGWIGNTWNELHYGSPRTYQVDAVVGHNDSATHPSHFIALNLHGQIEILEFPGGDVSRARVVCGTATLRSPSSSRAGDVALCHTCACIAAKYDRAGGEQPVSLRECPRHLPQPWYLMRLQLVAVVLRQRSNDRIQLVVGQMLWFLNLQ